MISNYLLHARKLIYVIIFGALVWFISFTIFPENQIIKISVGDISPVSFTAPNYIEVIDEEQTAINKALAVESVNPIYSIDTTINDAVINGVKDMFLAVIEARISETLLLMIQILLLKILNQKWKLKILQSSNKLKKLLSHFCFQLFQLPQLKF